MLDNEVMLKSFSLVTSFILLVVSNMIFLFMSWTPHPTTLEIHHEPIVNKRIVNNYRYMSSELSGKIRSWTVRTRCGPGTGSGVVIQSEQDTETGIFTNYVITNAHNIRPDPLRIEVFTYLNDRIVNGFHSYPAVCIAINRDLDLALVQTISTQPLPVASFSPSLGSLNLYDPVFVCGSGLGMPPYMTEGTLANLSSGELSLTAFAIFGNSGGGVYDDRGLLIGIVDRIQMVPVAESVIPIPDLSLAIPSPVVLAWLGSLDNFELKQQ